MRCGHGRDWRRKASGDVFATLCITTPIASCRNWDSTTPKACSMMPIRVAAYHRSKALRRRRCAASVLCDNNAVSFSICSLSSLRLLGIGHLCGYTLACHLKRVARVSKARSVTMCFTLVSRRHLCMAPAGNPRAFHGGPCVGVLGPPAWLLSGFRTTHRPPPLSLVLLSVLYGALP